MDVNRERERERKDGAVGVLGASRLPVESLNTKKEIEMASWWTFISSRAVIVVSSTLSLFLTLHIKARIQ